ncbi:MAG: imidazole glycerol phosphate synthase subunit HisH [Bacteroidetes bacterium]|nr:MAG: imidazole glycerol phosphate synthase subunit HisH [Bacteroidota bacterium]
MKLVIIKYNAGNIQSVLYALERLNVVPLVSDEPEEIRSADKVIFPGVGEASTTMRYLRNTGLHSLIPTLRQPVLGICLGMQLMCSYSEENDTHCLNIFDERVRRFKTEDPAFKIPHIGWNTLEELSGPLFQGIEEPAYAYFVHSYYVELGPHTIARTPYIQPFSAALHKGNFYATQFHPEKSGKAGATLLQNFLNL